jgi:predicted metal-binding membrane protein
MMSASSAPMMAAMMLPGALPATVRAVRASGRAAQAPLFAGAYFAVWTLVGLPLMGAAGAIALIQKELFA